MLFHFPDAEGRFEWAHFTDPVEVIVAHRVEDVRPALRAVQDAVGRGLYAAGFVGYEAAPAFDPALIVREGRGLPLLWFGLFGNPAATAPTDQEDAFSVTEWTPSLTRDAHREGIAAIRDAIAAGNVYQVNYTMRMRAHFHGEPQIFFHHLHRAQHPCYAADLNLGHFRILSASPELFFRRDGDQILTRPMKGTRPRGRWPEEDSKLNIDLLTCPKDRAENVMIVDLLRNDLGKIARPGSVYASKLCAVERFPTVWQMTSTIEATLDASVTLENIFTALFPCGSVTGAPKISAMRQISDLEDTPRGVYCGAIGYISPNNDAVFSVAIRTLTIDTETHTAEYGIGGGITWDSTADAEYDEAFSKAALLTTETPTFSLLETMRSDNRSYFLRRLHIKRLLASAHYFGFPVSRSAIDAALDAHAETLPRDHTRVRLLINARGEIHIEHALLNELPPEPLTVALAHSPVSSWDVFLFHKTTHRAVYNHHRAAHPDAFDVLLYNELGQLTEFTIGNLVIEQDNQRWTPPVHVGLLAGTFRAEMINRHKIEERILTHDDLKTATSIWLINSVRDWVPVKLEES